MADTTQQSDKSIGLGLLFGIVAVVGAAVMYVGAANTQTAGLGFALAVLAASLSISVIHIYG